MTTCREGPVIRRYRQYMRCTNSECLYEWYADLVSDYGLPMYLNDSEYCPECKADGEEVGRLGGRAER